MAKDGLDPLTRDLVLRRAVARVGALQLATNSAALALVRLESALAEEDGPDAMDALREASAASRNVMQLLAETFDIPERQHTAQLALPLAHRTCARCQTLTLGPYCYRCAKLTESVPEPEPMPEPDGTETRVRGDE